MRSRHALDCRAAVPTASRRGMALPCFSALCSRGLGRSLASLRLPSALQAKLLTARPAKQARSLAAGGTSGGSGGRRHVASASAPPCGSQPASIPSATMSDGHPTSQQQQQAERYHPHHQPKHRQRAAARLAAQQQQAAQGHTGQQQEQEQQDGGMAPGVRRERRASLWWKERPSYRCPACGQCCYKVPAFGAHILKCCPDVARPEEWQQLLAEADAAQAAAEAAGGAAGDGAEAANGSVDARQQQSAAAAAGSGQQDEQLGAQQQGQGEEQQQQQTGTPPHLRPHHADAAIRSWLQVVERREDALRERALDVAFRQRDAEGEPLRQGPPEIAAELGLPLDRAEQLFQAAKKAVPLAADYHPVEVLYEDDDLIAVNKPPGVITAPKHRFTGGSIVNRIIGTLGFEPLTLHRLDMNTTGVVLFAKKRDVVDGVHSQFRRKTVRKQYLALAVGVPPQASFSVDAPIDRDPEDVVARRVRPDGKPALTDFTVVESAAAADLATAGTAATRSDAALAAALAGGGLSLVSCRPLTGRTHQIRVHLAHAGHAILGDDLYGVTGPWIARHALHAAAITLTHPRTGQPLTVRAPVPPDFLEAMAQLGLQHVPGAEFSGPAAEEEGAAGGSGQVEAAAGDSGSEGEA